MKKRGNANRNWGWKLVSNSALSNPEKTKESQEKLTGKIDAFSDMKLTCYCGILLCNCYYVCVSGTMTEEMDSLLTNSNEDQELYAFSHVYLDDLIKYRSRFSTLEMLLVLHLYLDMSGECHCSGEIFFMPPFNIRTLSKCFKVMKDMIEFIATKISNKDFNLDWKSDYQLHLFHLLKISFIRIYKEIEIRSNPEDEVHQRMEDELLDTIDRITDDIAILFSRHGWHYRKEMLECSITSRVGPLVQLPIRHMFFTYYENCATIGKFPHIFWQDTPLCEKISYYDSLEAIFYNGNEDICCICTTDELKNNFAIFLDCNHLVCASCAERLLIDTTKTR